MSWAGGLLLSGFLLAGIGFVIGPALQVSEDQLRTFQAAEDMRSDLLSRISELEQMPDAAKLDPVLMISAETPALALAALQTTISDAARNADVSLSSLSARPDSDLGAYRKYALQIEFEAQYVQIVELLTLIEGTAPAIRIDNLAIRRLPGRGTPVDDPDLYVTMQVFAIASGGGDA